MTEKFNLEENEYICDKCGGTGRVNNFNPYHPYYSHRRKVFCPMCQGTGKLDWIENIVGKKPIVFRYENAVDNMAREMAKGIDREIIDSVVAAAKK